MKTKILALFLMILSTAAFAQTAGNGLKSADTSEVFSKGKYIRLNSADNAHYLKVFQNGTTPTITTDSAAVSFPNGISGNIAGNVTGNTSGNAATATVLAANPSDCSTGQFASAIDAGGNLTCSNLTTTAAVTTTVANAAGASASAFSDSANLGIMDGSDIFNGLLISLTNSNHTGSGNFVNGIRIGGITGDADATETAINIGDGWDVGINAGNNPISARDLTVTNQILSTSSADIGWSVVSGANTACTTTCTNGCVFGQNTADSHIVNCADATADVCVCAGSN